MSFRSLRLSFLGVAVCALLLPLAASGAAGGERQERDMSGFFGHDFWKQFERGFRHMEDSVRDDATQLEGMFNSWLSPRQQASQKHHHSDVEMLPTAEERDTEPVEIDGDIDDIDGDVDDVTDDFPGNFFNIFHGPTTRSWWSGPNVCVDREEINESQRHNDTESTDEDDDSILGSFQFSSCRQSETKYTCTTKIRSHGIRKTFIVRYQCCHGYRRIPGKPGCTEVNLKPMVQTMVELGAKVFPEMARATGVAEKLSSENLTVFTPTDEAVRDFSESLQAANQVDFYIPPGRSRRDTTNWENEAASGVNMKEVVLGHMVPGFQEIGDLVDEQVLYSDNNNSTLRFNMYAAPGERLLTINCARVTSINNYAENGIVHIIDRVIRPVTRTIGQLITEDAQFTRLREFLERTGQMQLLNEPGHLTLFAPIDVAFDNMDPAIRDRLLSSASNTCLKNVLGHHLLTHTLCSCAVTQRVATHTSVGTPLMLERSEDGKLFVGSGTQVVARDIMGTNGIIHVIEEILLPDSGLPVTTVLERQNLTQFAGLLKEASLAGVIDSADNVTVFAPSDDALRRPEAVAAIELARKSPEDLRNLLLFHTAKPEVHSCDITNNKEIASGLEGHSLRINLYATMPHFTLLGKRATVQCARITNLDEHACGGLIHQVDRLLVPPAGDAVQLLEASGNFSTFLRLLQETGLISELKENSPFTLLAPSDEVFARIPEPQMDTLTSDKELLTHVLRKHILPEVLCCSGVSVATWPFSSRAESLGGPLPLRRDYEGRIHMGGAAITSCDHVSNDGVVHFVNKVMMPSNPKYRRVIGHRSRNPNVEVFLYGL
ncbi:transforming growth factor-beta-induced protein ig-h3-like [Schistocerca nitens]|uniref:transforming growth factor-beta-induced protein ig-h3-like n=1 Tax=Schistocerca nitens TaxID=7011 RepID=UPI00211957AB|nr:transforming growth factor-beta-induced protein ig-h3-like [Schistocerca nitens]